MMMQTCTHLAAIEAVMPGADGCEDCLKWTSGCA